MEDNKIIKKTKIKKIINNEQNELIEDIDVKNMDENIYHR
jgi:hypothetical protein